MNPPARAGAGGTTADLSPTAIRVFRQLAFERGRMDHAALKETDADLIEKLKLVQ